MCLTIKKNTRVRTKPIKVWKVVKIVDGEYYSPFQNVPLPTTSDLVRDIGWNGPCVNIGIHAFPDERSAMDLVDMLKYASSVFMRRFNYSPSTQFKIITGTTKGKYYVGKDDSSRPCIAGKYIIWDC